MMLSSAMLAFAIFPLQSGYARSIGSSLQLQRQPSGCPTTGPASCHSTTEPTHSCCFESPGGLLLQTQFWDITGPSSALPMNWTVHGLWPDLCDGTHPTNCDPSRAYTGISTLIHDAGQTDLLDFMNTYWLDINGHNEHFWEHEWAAHGTCYSTLQPQCLPEGSPTGTEAIDFFLTVQKLFESLPTYTWLAQGGIEPSFTTTFTLSELTTVLSDAAGVVPALDCHEHSLNQISWYFNLKGSAIDGEFIPIDAPKAGSCPKSGIRYPPKPGSAGSEAFIYADQAAPFRNQYQLGRPLEGSVSDGYNLDITSAGNDEHENGRKWHGIDKTPAILLCSQ